MTDEEIKGRLEQEQERLQDTMEGILAGGDVTEGEAGSVEELTVIDQHPADVGTETLDQEVGHSLLERVRSELDDVEAALRRLDEGTYGRCEACGEPIGDERLEALPAARYCVLHQRLAEAGDQPSAGLGHL